MTASQSDQHGEPVSMALLGQRTPALPVAWTDKDVMLYALSVGASQDDPFADLALTTENSRDTALAVLPSFLTVMRTGGRPAAVDRIRTDSLLHAEQHIEILAPIPPSGEGSAWVEVTAVLDKGTGALVTSTTTFQRPDGTVFARSSGTLFVRGAGGFGGPRGTSATPAMPERAPDARVVHRTRPDQALLYRLNGDRNPLHSDPAQARLQGFERPILHGLCTFGFACRGLVTGAAGGDPARLRAMGGRFVKPVFPGEALATEIWQDQPGEVRFRVVDASGAPVFDRGSARIAPA
ncbi:MaoC/PaaZ C-terminal domain-containing protein [Novosphingobium bradum]|uniref:MaoC/PaaZ C-terminal domain-containing protein n=1 Tax=Novosphingobium bradum TaxID=1737444 RepID=A0ABV7IJ30_9SPHN